jgi:hypothetical protein
MVDRSRKARIERARKAAPPLALAKAAPAAPRKKKIYLPDAEPYTPTKALKLAPHPTPLPKDGAPGKDGERGLPGRAGRDGLDGADGLPGRDGKDGTDGTAGRDGRNGLDGHDGTDGHVGMDGTDGRDGRDGEDGADGLDGTPGRNGIDGHDGADGADGRPGRDGRDGHDGADGLPGTAGRDGIDGKPGAKGEKGDPGQRITNVVGGGFAPSGQPKPNDIAIWRDSVWHRIQPSELAALLSISVGGGFTHVNETPTGTIDGSNPTFHLADAPLNPTALMLYRNGLLMHGSGNDFSLAGDTIEFEAGNEPQSGSVLLATYS